MKRFTLLSTLLLLFGIARAQSVEPKSNEVAAYRTTSEKINNLVHTKLDAKFDYPKSQLNGKVWITLKPHFYTTDSLLLDAKGMDIKQVAVVKNARLPDGQGKNVPLKYDYDGMFLNINLDRPYKGQKPIPYILITRPSPMNMLAKAALPLQMQRDYILLIRVGRTKISLHKYGHKVKLKQLLFMFQPLINLTKKPHRNLF